MNESLTFVLVGFFFSHTHTQILKYCMKVKRDAVT